MVNSGLRIAFPLVCVLLIVAFVAPAIAEEYDQRARSAYYNPGVSVGQWVKYGNYVVTTPVESAVIPDWSMIEVVGVSGKEVTLRITGADKNGVAIPPSTLVCNIETGLIGVSGHQRYLIAANLNQGDRVLNLAVSDIINKTETRTYLGTSRSVNLLNFTVSSSSQSGSVVFIYDRASGMHLAMEMSLTIVGAETYENSYSVIDTNIFDTELIPEFTSWTPLLIVLLAVTVFGVFFKRKLQTEKYR